MIKYSVLQCIQQRSHKLITKVNRIYKHKTIFKSPITEITELIPNIFSLLHRRFPNCIRTSCPAKL